MKKVALFGGSFDPPGIHHRLIVKQILSLGHADKVIVIPCGRRNDKELEDLKDRKELVKLAFAGISRCIIDTFNLDLDIFTSNYHYESIFGHLGEIWHVVGSDQVVGANNKKSIIHKRWENGEFVFNNMNFLVIMRPGYYIKPNDLPPKSLVLNANITGSSTDIRNSILKKENPKLLTRNVLTYIKKNKLYKCVL